ncbi:MAG: lipopolysaccharide assembly protein LapA domain-containing protein [Pseudolabrys sp.]
MLRKALAAIILIPIVLLLVMFAVANRQVVTLSFDPFDAANPAYAVAVPLFVLIFVLVVLGVLLGGVAAWLRQSRWRRAARRLDGQMRRLNDEVHELRRREVERKSQPPSQSVPQPAPPSSPLPMLPPL